MKSIYKLQHKIIKDLSQDCAPPDIPTYQYLYKTFLICLLLLAITLISCKKFITVDPPITTINGGNVYSTDQTAIAVLTGIYTNMSSDNNNAFVHNGSGYTLLSLYPALSSDELTLYAGVSSQSYIAYYKNSLDNLVTGGTDFWNKFYPVIFKINSAIEGLNQSSTLTPSVRNQLLGESYFLRAFSYFYLVEMYGDVPLILSTDYSLTANQGRTAIDKVYEQILKDLDNAQNLLTDQYFDATLVKTTGERVRPNKSASGALLARVYLYKKDWTNAERWATTILDNKVTYDTVSLNNVFLKNSKETIWALQTIDLGINANTGEGRLFILPQTGPSSDYPVYLNQDLVKSFETADRRLTNWTKSIIVDGVNFSYPYKYKIGYQNAGSVEYPIILRLSEQYLIRAEARSQQGKITEAENDLNIIRKRAGLQSKTFNTSDELLTAILTERRHELFTEWGHRWFDLKRTNTIDEVMHVATAKKGGIWDSRWSLYPIPLESITSGINITQNIGY